MSNDDFYNSPNSDTYSRISQEFSTLLNDKFGVDDDDFSGTYDGLVVDNKDPDKYGRVRVRIFGKLDDIDDNDLPWVMPDFEFCGSKKGSFIIPEVGTTVKIYFSVSDVYFPRYKSKVIDIQNFPKNKDKNYPDNMIFFETDEGTSFEIDRSKDEVSLLHKSGSSLKIDQDGNITIDAKSKSTIRINVDGSVEVVSKNDISIKSDSNINIDAKKISMNGSHLTVE